MAKTKSGHGITSWGRESRGQPPPPVWLRQISGLRIDGEDVVASSVVAGLIEADDPAAFIRRHNHTDRPPPAGINLWREEHEVADRIPYDDHGKKASAAVADISARIWISNPRDTLLFLVGLMEVNGEVLLKVNEATAYRASNPFSSDRWTTLHIPIPRPLQRHGWNELSLEFVQKEGDPGRLLLRDAVWAF